MTKRVTSTYKQQIGKWGEGVAEKYLVSQGMETLARNFRTAHGEIDLVMRSGECIVFVEVKARTGDSYGMPELAVTETKKAHLAAAIEDYLSTLLKIPDQWRVDVVSVRGKPGTGNVEVTWFENALA